MNRKLVPKTMGLSILLMTLLCACPGGGDPLPLSPPEAGHHSDSGGPVVTSDAYHQPSDAIITDHHLPLSDAQGAMPDQGPPIYFAAFSPPMLALIAQQLQTSPVKEDYDQLLQHAQSWMSHAPAPPVLFELPEYYVDKEANRQAIKPLEEDASAAFSLALAYRLAPATSSAYADKAIEVLNAWATTNQGVKPLNIIEIVLNSGSRTLMMSVKGIRFLLAAELLETYAGWSSADRAAFATWVGTSFLPTATYVKQRHNNWADWGYLASLLAAAYVGDQTTVQADIDQVKNRLDTSIAANGELWQESLRNNSGMWYTYFSLSPITFSMVVAQNLTGTDLLHYTSSQNRSVKLALDKYFTYCLDPDSWPYKKADGILGQLQQVFFPSDDEVQIPKPDSWPGNLYEVMSVIFQQSAWESWAQPGRPFPSQGVNLWRYPALMRPAMTLFQ